jgi:hypothetical protein
MSIRVANGESVVPTTRRGGREHGRARRFIANMSMESLVGGNPGTAANSKDVEWDVASPNQSTESMRQEANEKEAVATHERLSAAGDLTAVKNEDAQYNINSPPAKTGTLGRLKNRLEESTIDLLGGNKVHMYMVGSEWKLMTLGRTIRMHRCKALAHLKVSFVYSINVSHTYTLS